MRRDIVWEGAHQLRYEIREIVAIANHLEALGVPIIWENIGDPVKKGEEVPGWIKEIIVNLVEQNASYSYTATAGWPDTREFLAADVNSRGGAQITKDDIIFFNGLGDAVSTLFGYLKREARVLGPSPAYSTLSSAEAAHSGYSHTTYELDPQNNWMPNITDIENKVRYNDAIAGILLINPDNPTGAVYPKSILREFVRIAKKYDLFLLCDETYAHVVYNGSHPYLLSEYIEDVPGIALRSISKEYPWPGGRCGWMEVFNQHRDKNFEEFVKSILDAKRLEVCSTSLPQMSIPLIFPDPRYREHLQKRNLAYEMRAREAVDVLSRIDGIHVNMPKGAFYLTILFDEGVLNSNQSMKIENAEARRFIENQVEGLETDKRFVYYLLGAAGICVVPLTGFCSNLKGFRMTILENDDAVRRNTLKVLAEKIKEYLAS